jgi:hypothetical protein
MKGINIECTTERMGKQEGLCCDYGLEKEKEGMNRYIQRLLSVFFDVKPCRFSLVEV